MSIVVFGDNQKVLKSNFFEHLKNKIKMIYIDPPYNTCTEKSYNDHISSLKWQNDVSNVIQLLSTFLSDDGVIFISIDDNEQAYLKVLCDNIFGKSNFIGSFITKQAQRSNSKHINIVHEYILCYAKNKNNIKEFSIKRMDIPEQRDMIEDIISQTKKELPKGKEKAERKLKELINYYCDKNQITWLKNYRCVDEEGNVFFPSDLSVPGQPREVNIDIINLHLKPLSTRNWTTDQKFIELYKNDLLYFLNGRPYHKKFLKDSVDNTPSILNFYSRQGTKDLNNLGLRDIFDTPKPVELIKFLIRLMDLSKDDYVLDCYAGSGTTAQSVIEINQEDNKQINFILIQNKEKLNEKSKSSNICKKYGINPLVSEITKLRINKVCEKYKIQNVEYFDYEKFVTQGQFSTH